MLVLLLIFAMGVYRLIILINRTESVIRKNTLIKVGLNPLIDFSEKKISLAFMITDNFGAN